MPHETAEHRNGATFTETDSDLQMIIIINKAYVAVKKIFVGKGAVLKALFKNA
ncbi:hypothetical protein [Aliamphritea ceti]|uniref:hypothetical protein n=1 Tax=Aliamphritea ceti TaxID=1524258 RepID=UPI0021C4BAC0|nr:hypothetical protein [Aliamphritea ceti]